MWAFSPGQPLTFPIRGYADRDSTDSILHSCFDLLFAEAASLSLCYPICPVRKENKQSPTHRKLIFFVRNIPGYRVFLSPSSTLGFILPRIPVICRGNNHFFKDKHTRTLICTVERQHSWFRCRSLWICWLGCNFHSKNLLLAVCTNSWFTDYSGLLISKWWANPCSRWCCSYQSQELEILQSS